jgi:hypothetical protein
MPDDLLQAQRHELKYIIPEGLAERVRDFIQAYLELDPFGSLQSDRSYPVHSLYLDSPDLYLHQSTVNGDRNRYKLRLRFYENRPGAPVYFEIKRRENNAIYKERCPVRRDSVEAVLAGRFPCVEDLAEVSPAYERSLMTFCNCLNKLQAVPVAHVSYRREAWLSHGSNRVRITFDRHVMTCVERTVRLDPILRDPVRVFDGDVVLELKFTGRFPRWMRDLVQAFGLQQRSAAKYADGITRMAERSMIRVPQPSVGGAAIKDDAASLFGASPHHA